MEYEYQETKQGHPGLALLLGIFAILIAFFVGGVFGLLGIVPAAILAVIAIVLGAGAVRAAGRGKGAIVTGVLALLLLFTAVPRVSGMIGNFSGLKDDGRTGVYSDDAVDAYQFIRENVEEDKIIAFGKPRGLYLSTGRVSIWPGRNGHKLKDADYLLTNRLNMFEYTYYKEDDVKKIYPCVFENRDFALYDLSKRVSR